MITQDLISTLQDMRDRIDMILDDAIAPIDADEAPPASRPVFTGRPQHRRLTTTDWPKIGGRALDLSHTDLFSSEAYREAPTGETRALYAAACDGLGRLSHDLKIPLYKIGCTSPDRVWPRTHELRADRYGSAYFDGTAYVEDETGFDGWYPSHLHVGRRTPSMGSPVRVETRAILVDLPASLTPENFDRLFDAETRKGWIAEWVATEEGRDHCALVGVAPARYQRFTLYPGGTTPRLSHAAEIAAFSIYEGASRLVAIAEQIILRHLGLLSD